MGDRGSWLYGAHYFFKYSISIVINTIILIITTTYYVLLLLLILLILVLLLLLVVVVVAVVVIHFISIAIARRLPHERQPRRGRAHGPSTPLPSMHL